MTDNDRSMLALMFCTISLLILVGGGWDLLGLFTYIEVLRTNNSVDMNTVMILTRATSLLQCLFHINGNNPTHFKPFYFEKSSELCYYIDGQSDNISTVTTNASIYYCRAKQLYQVEIVPGHRRITFFNRNYSSCAEIYNDGLRHEGVYRMNSLGDNFTDNFLPCYDGWTVFQRRIDGSVNFTRGWDDYVNGFGNKIGEFWLGLDTIYQLTSQGTCELYLYLRAEENHPIQTVGYARYSYFQLEGPETNYTLNVSGFSGNVTDSFLYHHGKQFSTIDRDNDEFSSGSCADIYNGGWWYGACHSSNLNGKYLNGSHATYADGIEWSRTWTYYYSLIEVEMRLKCA